MAKWQWGRVFSQHFGLLFSVSFHQRFTLIIMYMLLLPEGQTDKAWEPSDKECSIANRDH
jgi:hypothetical protein